MIAIKVSKSVGILNELYNFIPLKIGLIIYHSFIASNFNYGILALGFKCHNLLIWHFCEHDSMFWGTCSMQCCHIQEYVSQMQNKIYIQVWLFGS